MSLVRRMWSEDAVRYLTAGILSFGFDVGLLWLLHDVLGVALPIATPLAFLASFLVTYTLQRVLAFRARSSVPKSAAKYTLLVAVNTVLTTGIVWGVAELGAPWLAGKTVAVIVTTVGNYFAYRHWVFSPPKETSSRV